MKALAKQLATVFGIGHVSIASGTVASAAALIPGWIIGAFFGSVGLLFASIIATLAGIWACGVYAAGLLIEDPSECVLDEVAGQWLALVPVFYLGEVTDWLAIAVAFLLFRTLDILKPWPIYPLEKLHGGLGIMADDVAAGIIAAVLLGFAMWFGWL